MRVPDGVAIFGLEPHPDHRGVFTEIFRDEFLSGVRFVQWNVVHSVSGVLRGVHVHRKHVDYLTLASGSMQLGLCDLRKDSPTYRFATTLELTPARAIMIPTGVAHGFHFLEPAIHLYAVSQYWDPTDELGCHWADPGLGIPWDVHDPVLSPRDTALSDLSSLMKELG